MAVLMRIMIFIHDLRRTARYGLSIAILCAASAHAEEPLEYAVKAAYLTKFGIYVEWPDKPAASSPLMLCIAGADPFGRTLDSTAEKQLPGSRPITVRRLNTVTGESGCNVLYINSTDPAAPKTFNDLRGSPVLTVSNSPGSGAIINFVLKDNRVRFEINEAAATQNKLVLSAKLLGLALNVKERR